MKEYVERAAVLSYPIRKDHCDKEHANEHFIFGIESVMEYVENLPAADVVEVRHGRWIVFDPKNAESKKCFMCGYLFSRLYPSNYCPNCGAPMTDEAVDMVIERMEALHGQETERPVSRR